MAAPLPQSFGQPARRWRRDWKTPAHPGSEHHKFFEVQGLCVFAIRWRDTARARSEELQRRWQLQQLVTSVLERKRQTEQRKRVYWDPAAAPEEADALRLRLTTLAMDAKRPHGSKQKLASLEYADAAKTRVRASEPPIHIEVDEDLAAGQGRPLRLLPRRGGGGGGEPGGETPPGGGPAPRAVERRAVDCRATKSSRLCIRRPCIRRLQGHPRAGRSG